MTRWLMLALSFFIAGLLCIDPPAKAYWQSVQQVAVSGGGGGTVGTVTVDGTCGTTGKDQVSSSSSTSFNYTGLSSVSSGLTNPALIWLIVTTQSVAITGLTVNWDNAGTPQTAFSIGSAIVAGGKEVRAYGLRNPTPGSSLVSRLTWTGASQVLVAMCSLYGVNPASDAAAFNNFNSSTGTSSPQRVAITSAANNMVFAGFVSNTNYASVNNSQVFLNNTAIAYAAAGNRAAGAASVNMDATTGDTASPAAGFNVSHD